MKTLACTILFALGLLFTVLRCAAQVPAGGTWLAAGTVPAATGSYTDPGTISGLAAWWKADSISGSDGDRIATWSTSASPSRDATDNSNTPQRPYLKLNVQNSTRVVRFYGTNYLNFTPTSLTNFTVFIALSVSSGNGNYRGPLAWRTAGQYGFVIPNNSSTWQPLLGIYNGTSETSNQKASAAVSLPLAFQIATWTSSPAYWTNGVSVSLTSGESGWSAHSKIGYGYDPFVGDIGEIIVVDRVMSSAEIAGWVGYLKTRWGL